MAHGYHPYGGFPDYVPVAERRERAARTLAQLRGRGLTPAPVMVEPRRPIATTFWGKAWCSHLESYADLASRLPRGRSYVRNGSVIDLQIAKGQVRALVSGTEIYDATVAVTPLAAARWKAVRRECTGQIATVVEHRPGCAGGSGAREAPTRTSAAASRTRCSGSDRTSVTSHMAAREGSSWRKRSIQRSSPVTWSSPVTKASTPAVHPLLGTSGLAVQAILGIVDLVEAMQHEIAGGPRVLGRPLLGPTRLFSAPVYASIRGATRLVGAGVDLALSRLGPLLGEVGAAGLEPAAAIAFLNGVIGDYLAESGNPLAIEMRLRHEGRPLEPERGALRRAYPHARSRLLVLVHGSCRNDRQWRRHGRDHVTELAQELGFTPVHLRYNTGLHIAANGRALAALLERLVAAWPVSLRELAVVGHSMGGLVARSACHAGDAEGHAWRRKLRKLVCIGSPHHGAPLERGGHWIDVLLEVSRYSAPLARLGRIRSAGVTDMRFGNVLDEHRDARGRFAFGGDLRRELTLPRGTRCYAIAGTHTPRPGSRLASDGIVPVDSALGRHRNPKLNLPFDDTWIGYGIGHLDLLGRDDVDAVLRSWLS